MPCRVQLVTAPVFGLICPPNLFLLFAKEAQYHKPSLTMKNQMQAKLLVTFTEMKAE